MNSISLENILFIKSYNSPMLLTILMSLATPLTAEQCSVTEVPVSDLEESLLQQSRLQVSADLLRTAALQQRMQNLLLSPFTIHSGLLLLFFAASGDTEQLLRKLLHIPDTLSKDTVLGQYLRERKADELQDDGHELVNVNRLYVESGLDIRQCMTSLFPKEYHTVNMTNQDVTANDIRHWIANETNNEIILNPSWKSEFSFNTMLKSIISINAAYFKGVWLNQFLKTETKKERFYTCNEEFSEVDMMATSGFFRLWSDQGSPVKILEIPYNGRTISMIIVMPNQKHHEGLLHEFLYKFTSEDFENVLRVLSKKIPSTILVRLPKMIIEKEYNLQQVLNHMGGDLLFGAVTNFEDLFVKSRCVTVLKTVLHNAKVELNEEGSIKKDIASKYRRKFIVNRPFVYFIYQKPTKRILFSGIFYSP